MTVRATTASAIFVAEVRQAYQAVALLLAPSLIAARAEGP